MSTAVHSCCHTKEIPQRHARVGPLCGGPSGLPRKRSLLAQERDGSFQRRARWLASFVNPDRVVSAEVLGYAGWIFRRTAPQVCIASNTPSARPPERIADRKSLMALSHNS
jgi:hypothetical protein